MTAIAIEKETNNFWHLIRHADNQVKLALIHRLSASLIGEEPQEAVSEKNWASRFAGAWKDSRSTEEIINDIHDSRTQNSEIQL